MTDPVDEALAYAAKWNQTMPTKKGMNYHLQVLAGEVERRRSRDGLVAELIEFLRFFERRCPGRTRVLVRGKLNLYDNVNDTKEVESNDG